ncbi:MAG TPA: hypothetical protein DCY24_01300 [Rikenellaceae bacterium]|nr:hypothetical protein [Rikenellaceae bacterium]
MMADEPPARMAWESSKEAAPSSSEEFVTEYAVSAFPLVTGASAVDEAAGFSVTENSQTSGAAQNWSLQPLQETSPVTVASFAVNLIN